MNQVVKQEPQRRTIRRLVGVYDADGTVAGEVRYWVLARFGAAHCSLCDITHGVFRVRADWQRCQAAMAVPFDTFHRDDQPAHIRAAAGGVAPVVVAEVVAEGEGDGADEVVVLCGPDVLDACAGDPIALRAALRLAAARLSLDDVFGDGGSPG